MHIGIVDNGSVMIKQRNLNNGDWNWYDISPKHGLAPATNSLENIIYLTTIKKIHYEFAVVTIA